MKSGKDFCWQTSHGMICLKKIMPENSIETAYISQLKGANDYGQNDKVEYNV